MEKMVKFLCFCILMGAFSASIATAQDQKPPLIQMAILLDTSGSMEGVIHQARTQLWKIVNELATTKKDGKIPELQVALYEYGNDGLRAEGGYLRKILDLTTDLDKVSEQLFALTTNGGSEYCGWVIEAATKELAWSKSNADFKAIFIAGNEPFTQGPIDFRKSCKNAISQGVVVNTIHCGSYEQGISGLWREGALLADGSYLNIDQNQKVVEIQAPQDAEILRLNSELNTTYLSYGEEGEVSQKRQQEQDANLAQSSYSGNINRAVSKASAQYRNESWDLVDAVKQGSVNIEEIAAEDLPQEMQKMTVEERKAYVAEQEMRRAEIQAKIQALNKEREIYITEQRKKLAASGGDTLDAAMIKALRKQLEQKNFKSE